jgi:ABC-type sugar transport system ATPase subunit
MYMYKVFPTTSVQMFMNMSRNGKIGMLAGLWLLTGLTGLPFAEDLEDVIDTLAQKLKISGWRGARYETAQFIDGIFPGMSPLLLKGIVNNVMPADVAGRTSLGDLLPGTAAIKAEIDAEVRRTAELLSIEALLERKPGQLSGGQRQRVALGRAIVRHPQAFLLDEPLSNLDAALRVQTRKEIVELHRRVGASTIYVTHDQTEAMTMSDRVAVMMGGEILQIASPREIYLDPADLRVAAFVGSPKINTIAAEADGDGAVRIGRASTGVVAAMRGPLTFAVRPEDLTPGAAQGFPARVEHMEFLGEALLLHARLENGGESVVLRLDGRMGPPAAIGASIKLSADPARVFLFDGNGKRVKSRPAGAPHRARSALEAAHG